MNKLISDNAQHKESILTHEFTDWYKSKFGYIELFDDGDTSGSDPFDSGGLIGNKIVFIEFKYRISLSQIYYEGSRGSSIEKKIGQLLSLIYHKVDCKTYNSVSSNFTNRTQPKILLVVNEISNRSKEHLQKLLQERSKLWQFSYELIRWHGKEGTTLLEETPVFKNPILNNQITIPEFPNTAPKRTNKLTYEKVVSHMDTIEQAANFKQLFYFFKEEGATFNWNATCVNIKFPKFNGNAVLGFWIYKSTIQDGILVTYNVGVLNDYFQLGITNSQELKLNRNPFKVGNLGYNAFLKTAKEVTTFLAQLNS